MRTLLAIDPGLHSCGISLWNNGSLVNAALVPNLDSTWTGMALGIKEYIASFLTYVSNGVIEIPQVYRHGKGDPEDLIQLAGVCGAIKGVLGGSWTDVKPREWKGQVPKEVMVQRIQKKLSTIEIGAVVLPQKSLAHNVWDSVGIGLWSLGRL